jgi:hypothetical protein
MGDSSAARGTYRRPARTRAPDLPRRDALAAPATSLALGLALAALRPRPTRPARHALRRAPGPTRDTDLDPSEDDSPRPRASSRYRVGRRLASTPRLEPLSRRKTTRLDPAPRAAIASEDDSSAARGTYRRPARTRAPDLARRDAPAAPATSPALGLALAALRSRPTRPARRALRKTTRHDPAPRAAIAPRATIARQPPHRRARPTRPGTRPPRSRARTGPARRPARASLRPGPHGHGHVTKARPRHVTLRERDSVT